MCKTAKGFICLCLNVLFMGSGYNMIQWININPRLTSLITLGAFTQMETGSVGVEGRRRRSAAGMTADSLRL